MKAEIISVANAPQSSPEITINLQNLGLLFGILVSFCTLLTLAYKVIATINKLSLSIVQLDKDLKEFVVQGEKDSADAIANAEKIRHLESRLDLHIQDYVNRKDVVQMLMGQLNEKIDHKFKRLLSYSRDIQRFLQKDTNFQVREYEERKDNLEEE